MSAQRSAASAAARADSSGSEGQWRCVVARLQDSVSEAERPSPSLSSLPAAVGRAVILASRVFAPGEPISGLSQWLESQNVGRILSLVPAAESVVRSVELPELESDASADRPAIAEALALVAESEAPGVAWWRRGAGVLARPSEEFPARAVVCSWIGDASGALPNIPASLAAETQYITPVAALAGLGAFISRAHSPLSLIAYCDQPSSHVSVVAWGRDKAVARAARDRSSEPEPAQSRGSASSKVVSEVALGVGIDPATVTTSGAFSVASHGHAENPDSLHEPFPKWVAEWGLAIGALAVMASTDPAESALATLRATEPVPHVAPFERVVRWVSRPRVAAGLIAAAVGLGVLVPMASAWGRLRVMESRAREAKLEDRLAEAEQRVGFYDLLFEKRWPMSKLLADVAASAPPGIEVESVELTQGESVAIRGQAQKSDLVARFRENLAKTKVFSQLATPSVDSGGGGGVRFQLTAKIIGNGALYEGAWAEDYTTQTLGQRLFGESWNEPEIAAAEPESDRAVTRRRGSAPDSEARGTGASAAGSASTQSFTPPPPLTDAEIAKMDKATAMKEFGQRKAAAAKASDPDVKQRLNDEAEKAKQRMLQAPASSGAGGGGGA